MSVRLWSSPTMTFPCGSVGSLATFYINGTRFEELEGSPPENGQQIGLFAASPPGGPARFGFDNLGKLAEEGDKYVKAGVEMIEKFRPVADY